ncbi:MAG: hypothetical protein ABSA26_12290 [Thermoguttaceae bacterium]|jgi:hypothetical protein
MVIATCNQHQSKNAADMMMPRHQCHFRSVIVLVSSLSPADDPAPIVSILTVIIQAEFIDRYNAAMRAHDPYYLAPGVFTGGLNN